MNHQADLKLGVNTCLGQYRRDMLALLDSIRPQSLLLVAPENPSFLAKDAQTRPWLRISSPNAEDLIHARIERKPVEVAIVVHALERLNKADGEALIARLRDLYSQRLYLFVAFATGRNQSDPIWRTSDLAALGLRAIKAYQCDGRSNELFQFDMFDYKITPDWLSPRFWANPEMWNKARW